MLTRADFNAFGAYNPFVVMVGTDSNPISTMFLEGFSTVFEKSLRFFEFFDFFSSKLRVYVRFWREF